MTRLEQRKLPKDSRKPQRANGGAKKKSKNCERQMKKKDATKRIRDLSRKLRDDINKEQRQAHESRRANIARKEDNEKKNMVLQKIKNDKAIRKLSPKHRKKARIFMLHEL